MHSFKKCVVALSINLALFSSAFACTTLLVGSEASADGSMMVARSADSDALKAQHFVIHPAKQGQSGVHSSKAHNGANNFSYPLPKNSLRYTTDNFSYPLPKNSLRYTTVPNWKTSCTVPPGSMRRGSG